MRHKLPEHPQVSAPHHAGRGVPDLPPSPTSDRLSILAITDVLTKQLTHLETAVDALQQRLGVALVMVDTPSAPPLIPPSGSELGHMLSSCTARLDGLTQQIRSLTDQVDL